MVFNLFVVYIIIVYDVEERHVAKVHKYLKTKITWIQNSVFEGEITQSELVEMKSTLRKLINKKQDSIIMFLFRSDKYVKRQIIGIEKNETSNVL